MTTIKGVKRKRISACWANSLLNNFTLLFFGEGWDRCLRNALVSASERGYNGGFGNQPWGKSKRELKRIGLGGVGVLRRVKPKERAGRKKN